MDHHISVPDGFYFARFTEDDPLSWFMVEVLDGAPTVAEPLTAWTGDTMPASRFKATHRHYKGGLYMAAGFIIPAKKRVLCVFYRDVAGQFWLRPKDMFEGRIESGEKRFEQLDAVA